MARIACAERGRGVSSPWLGRRAARRTARRQRPVLQGVADVGGGRAQQDHEDRREDEEDQREQDLHRQLGRLLPGPLPPLRCASRSAEVFRTRPTGMPRASACVSVSTKFDSSGTSVRRFRFWRASRRGRPSSISRSVRANSSASGEAKLLAHDAEGALEAHAGLDGDGEQVERVGQVPADGVACAPRPCGRATTSGSWAPHDRAGATRAAMASRRRRWSPVTTTRTPRRPPTTAAQHLEADDLLGPELRRQAGVHELAVDPVAVVAGAGRRRARLRRLPAIGRTTRARNGSASSCWNSSCLVGRGRGCGGSRRRRLRPRPSACAGRARRATSAGAADAGAGREQRRPSDVHLDHAEDDDHAEGDRAPGRRRARSSPSPRNIGSR